jgi:Rieske Fe-S protein
MSMWVGPAVRAQRRPVFAVTTSRTAAGSATMVITTSERWTSSASEPAAFAPAATNVPIFDRVRLYTITSWPFDRTFRHIGSPMIPRPMKPTFAIAPPPRTMEFQAGNPVLTRLAESSE